MSEIASLSVMLFYALMYHVFMRDIRKLLGARIRELRRQRNLTQDQLTELAGMESASLSKIETGKRYPAPETIDALARALDVLPSQLFTFEHLIMPTPEKAMEEINEAMRNNPQLIPLLYISMKNMGY